MKTLTRLPRLEHLYEVHSFGPVSLRFESSVIPPSDELVSNVHLVPFATTGCVVVQVVEGDLHKWIVPGGTLEPGERWPEAARRELLEEAGARVLSTTSIGVLRGHTTAAEPWRAHLPHPDFFWIVGWAEVELVCAPTQPPDGEVIVEVACVDIGEAVARLEGCGSGWAADIYRLAAYLRSNACDAACA